MDDTVRVPHPERISLMCRFNGYFVWSVNPAGHYYLKHGTCVWVAFIGPGEEDPASIRPS